MPDAVSSAWVEVLPDFSQFRAQSNSQIPSILGSAGDSGAASFGTSFKSGVGTVFAGSFLANIAGSFARGVGELIGTGIRSGLEYGLDSVSLASGLEQSQGAVDSIFKDFSSTIHNMAQQADKDLGLSENSYNELASVIGAQLKNGGTSIDRLAEKTADIIEIGGDLAAQFGGSTKDAVSALSSAFKGERDPIERYGVSLTQAAIDAKAAELGFSKVNGTLSTQANQAATLALVLDQTRDAAGQFNLQQNTMAEQQQILNAQLENAQTSLGEHLLPAFTNAASFANETLVPALNDVIDTVGPKLAQAISDATPAIEDFATKLAPIASKFADLGVEILPGVIDQVNKELSDKSLIGGLPGAIENAQTFFEIVDQWWQGQYQASKDRSFFVEWTDDGIQFMDNAQHVAYVAEQAMKDASVNTNQYWESSLTNITATAVAQVPGLTGAGQQLGSGFAKGITDSTAEVIGAISQLGDIAYNTMRDRMKIKSPSRLFAELGGYVGEGFAVGIDGTQGAVASSISSLVNVPNVRANLSLAIGGSTAMAGGHQFNITESVDATATAMEVVRRLNSGMAS